MIKFISKFFLLAIGIAVLVFWTMPKYKETLALKDDQAKYNKALADSKELMSVKKNLSDKYSAIDQITLEKITKMLPDNVDNIKLILEISRIGEKYGMVIKNVKFDTFNKNTKLSTDTTNTIVQSNQQALESSKDYGSFDLEFSVEGTYPNFVKFSSDIEKSLRIVDISGISFSSVDSNLTKNTAVAGAVPSKPTDVNKYDFKITTYWLKN